MAPRGPGPLASVTLLAALLSLGHVQYGVALVGVVWQTSVLSFDHPATQIVHQTASQTVPHTDPARQTRERLARGLSHVGRLPLPGAAWVESPALSRGITRSPPVAPLTDRSR